MLLLEFMEKFIENHDDLVIKFLDYNDFIKLFILSKDFNILIKRTKNLTINAHLLSRILQLTSKDYLNVLTMKYHYYNDIIVSFDLKKMNIEFLEQIIKVYPFLNSNLNLVFKNVDFTKFFELNYDALNLFHSINIQLSIYEKIKDISFVNNLKHINSMSLSYNDIMRMPYNTDMIYMIDMIDLTPLVGIKKITLRGFNNIYDISPLMNVEELILEQCNNIRDISCLKKIKKLFIINCDGIKIIPTISTLEKLILIDDNGTNIRTLNYLPSIKHFKIKGKFELVEPTIFANTIFEIFIIIYVPDKNFKCPIIKKTKKLFIEICSGRYEICEKNIISLNNFKDIEELRIIGHSNITEINSFPNLKVLLVANCINLHTISDLAELKELKIERCYGLHTIRNLPKLEELELINYRTDHLEPKLLKISTLSNIKNVNIHGYVPLEDFSGLSNAKIWKFINLDKDVSIDLSGLKNVETLTLEYCSNFKNLDELKQNTTLKKIIIKKCSNLTDIRGLINVKEIKIVDCVKLNLYLSSNLSSLKSVEKLSIKSRTLEDNDEQDGHYISKGISDISGLLDCPNLKEIEFIQCDELVNISYLKNIEIINFENCNKIDYSTYQKN